MQSKPIEFIRMSAHPTMRISQAFSDITLSSGHALHLFAPATPGYYVTHDLVKNALSFSYWDGRDWRTSAKGLPRPTFQKRAQDFIFYGTHFDLAARLNVEIHEGIVHIQRYNAISGLAYMHNAVMYWAKRSRRK